MNRRRLLALAALLAASILVGLPAEDLRASEPSDRASRSAPSAIVDGAVDRTSADLQATYDARASLEWDTGRLFVRSVAHVVNTSGGPIDRLELNTVAAALGGMVVLAAKVDGSPVEVVVRGQTIIVPLGGVLPEDAAATVIIRYRATLRPGIGGRDWLWTRANGIASVYRWIPWVSLERPWPTGGRIGDPFFTTISPSVRVRLSAGRQMTFATNGERVAEDGFEQTFEAQNVRDFNFTAAPDYVRTDALSADGETPITLFTRTQPAHRLLFWVRQAMTAFESRIAPYPYPRLVVAEASGASMETPGLIWVETDLPSSRRAYIGIHETAHQWFYGSVGNDQPMEPFADEAVADFLTRWQIGFRNSVCAKDRLDGSVLDYSWGCMYEVVYVQGGLFLNQIRSDIGSQRFWRALRSYYDANQDGFGGTRELLEAFRTQAVKAGVNLMPRYRDRFPTIY